MNREKILKIGAAKPAGFLFGVIFGFLLQKGGATKYNVIVGQLLLDDFTVVKIMLSAVVTGMLGIYVMQKMGWIEFHRKKGSLGKNVVGGLLFGVGFALLGYCPGTIAGAVGNGYLDAAVGGTVGIVAGTSLFAALYPWLDKKILQKGDFGDTSLAQLLRINEWIVVIPVAGLIILLLVYLESAGL